MDALHNYNPISKVGGVTFPHCPSSYTYNIEDVSSANAGRTEDTVMHKERIGQVVSLNLEWKNVKTSVASAVLKAFQPEYVDVEYFDLLRNAYRTVTFYTGNRKSPVYNARLGVWTLTFNIIEQGGNPIYSGS